MDGFTGLHPPAQDSATSGYSSAAKGGLAGVLVMLLAIVVYVFFKRQNCLEEGDPGKVQVTNIMVQMGERSVGNKEESMKNPDASTVPF
ncbi:hypothetical protein POTOM_041711 [Populus tomentosa]|uniref:Uncharacterized protein n=1 Tax=Populus tomentosa TaxID=118781 RepID=A0A8X8CHL7_POPTO|nr:hypothetical protein POTOM_041711 [Populus tomentosa]